MSSGCGAGPAWPTDSGVSAQVVRVGGGVVRVRFDAPTEGCCSDCASRGCGAGLFARALRGRRGATLDIASEQSLAPGDRVRVAVPRERVGRVLALALAAPLGLLLLAIAVTARWGDAVTVPAAVTALICGTLCARSVLRQCATEAALEPVIVPGGQGPACPEPRT